MNDFEVAIPTYRRPDYIHKTLLMFSGIPKNRIHVLFANEEERESYSLDAGYNQVVTAPGLVASRQKAQEEYFDEGDRVLWCNDDVRKIERKAGNGRSIARVEEVAAEGFSLATELWGIYPLANGMFMRDKANTGLSFIVGCFYGIVNRRGVTYSRIVHGAYKEDYERSLRYFNRFGSVARLEYFAPATTYYNAKGGYAGIRNYQDTLDNVNGLLAEFPCQVKLRTLQGASGYPEIRIGRYC